MSGREGGSDGERVLVSFLILNVAVLLHKLCLLGVFRCVFSGKLLFLKKYAKKILKCHMDAES